MNRLVLTTAVAALVTACVTDGDIASSEHAVVDDTPDAIGLLALLNDPATTVTVLDDQVPLDRRAATNLIAHRDGADGAFGTADDDRFDSVGEVDDVSYVGPSAMTALLAYAASHGYTPSGDDLLGTYDGVPFTVAEGERALRAANDYSDGVLRYEAGLDPRAVNSIVNARPILSVRELAELYWVGKAMLQRLKDYTAVTAPAERADCRSNADCPTDWRCTGFAFDGSTDYGKCYPTATPPGANASCGSTADCAADLVCLGEYAWGNGFCVPAWQRDTFVNDTQRSIPAEAGAVVATGTVVYGLATVPVDIVFRHDIRHSDPHALKITVRSQTGDEAVVWDGPHTSGPMPAEMIARSIPSDDYVNGRWLVLIENVTGRGSGNSYGWSLEITSQWD